MSGGTFVPRNDCPGGGGGGGGGDTFPGGQPFFRQIDREHSIVYI